MPNKPEFFNGNRYATEIAPAAATGLIGHSGSNDLDVYIPGDVPANQRMGMNHGAIYIDGNLGAGSTVNMRQGVASAAALQKGAEINGGSLLILSNETLSFASKNLSGPNANHAPVMVVPEANRAQVFSIAAQTLGRAADITYELEDFKLALDKALPTLPIRFIIPNEQNQRAFKAAGFGGITKA